MDSGRQEGRVAGMKQGYYEGKEMGMRKGVELGREVCFYIACAHCWTELTARHPEAVSARCLQSLQRLQALLRSESMRSPLHPDFFDSLQTVRTRFKQLLVALGVQSCIRRAADDLDTATAAAEEGGAALSMQSIARAAELSF